MREIAGLMLADGLGQQPPRWGIARCPRLSFLQPVPPFRPHARLLQARDP
jgi:hypothetical protein